MALPHSKDQLDQLPMEALCAPSFNNDMINRVNACLKEQMVSKLFIPPPLLKVPPATKKIDCSEFIVVAIHAYKDLINCSQT